MKSTRLAFAAILLLAVAAAQAQTQQRVRGTITALEGNVLLVKSRDGSDVRIELPEKVAIGTVKVVALADIKPGDFVGTTAVKGDDGMLVAREVHVLPPNTNPGHRPWDLEPGSTMTNANVATVVQGTKGRVLTLEYQGGSQKILVPESVPVVRGIPAERSDLKAGEYVLATVEAAADGKLTAVRVAVSKNGVRPPQ
jgi:hypothetical protein